VSELRKAVLTWTIGGIDFGILTTDEVSQALLDVTVLTDSDLQERWGYLLEVKGAVRVGVDSLSTL